VGFAKTDQRFLHEKNVLAWWSKTGWRLLTEASTGRQIVSGE